MDRPSSVSVTRTSAAANRAAWMHAVEANAARAAAAPAQPESAALAAEATAPAAAPADSLPRTGVATDLLAIVAVVLVGSGFVLVRLGRRRSALA